MSPCCQSLWYTPHTDDPTESIQHPFEVGTIITVSLLMCRIEV